jgi:hypothetical protein
MKGFIVRILHQILLGWSNEGRWDSSRFNPVLPLEKSSQHEKARERNNVFYIRIRPYEVINILLASSQINLE